MNFRFLWRIYGKAFVIALMVLYLPQIWTLWHAFRSESGDPGMTLAMFPILPGGFIAAVIQAIYWNQFQQQMPGFLLVLLALLFTLLLIAMLTVTGSRGKGFQIAAIILGTGYSVVAAMGLHAAANL